MAGDEKKGYSFLDEPIKRRKPVESPLDEALRLAHENGMSYKEFQVKETLGKAYIQDGKMIILD